MKQPRYNPEMRVQNDRLYPTGKRICCCCGEEKKLRDFIVSKHSQTGQLYRASRCRKCSTKKNSERDRSVDRNRNKAHRYGEPERTATGKQIRTDHLEKYIRTAW